MSLVQHTLYKVANQNHLRNLEMHFPNGDSSLSCVGSVGLAGSTRKVRLWPTLTKMQLKYISGKTRKCFDLANTDL